MIHKYQANNGDLYQGMQFNQNMIEVLSFCNNKNIAAANISDTKPKISVNTETGPIEVFEGDYILKKPDGKFKVLNEETVKLLFKEI